jgi:2',3'-cyclic-nucleotide 2'-phosphodiesterase (5'-nucleotidase family)
MFKRFISYIFLFIAISGIFVSCRVHYNINDNNTTATVLAIDSISVPSDDSASLAIIAPYKTSLQDQMNEVLGYSERGMSKDQPEGLLNNFIADLVLFMANKYYQPHDSSKINICLLNNGGLRGSIPKGAILMRSIFELVPFENRLVVLELSGSRAKEMFNYVAHENGMPIAGVQMGIKNEKAVNITINSVPFDTTGNYTVVTSDYLANGGDRYNFFMNPLKRTDLDQKVREAIVEYLKMLTGEGKTVDVKLDKRIYYEK